MMFVALRRATDVLRPVWICGPLLALLVSIQGCGRGEALVPVAGVLRLRGAPAANVLVVFSPDQTRGSSVRSLAVTDADGRFTLRTDDGRPGAVRGRHRVTLEDMNVYSVERTEKPPTKGDPAPTLRVPAEYTTLSTTPLTEDVKDNNEPVTLDVPSTTRLTH